MQKFTAAICLLLLAGTVGMWVRSYRAYDQVMFARSRDYRTTVLWGFTSNRGSCRLGWQESEIPGREGFSHGSGAAFAWTGEKTFMNRIGFGWGSGRNVLIEDESISFQSLVFPYWAVAAVIAGVPPLRWWLVRRRRRREAAVTGMAGGRRWFDRPRVRPLVTPVTVLAVALIAGFCAVTSMLDLVMMFAGLLTPSFSFFVVAGVTTFATVWLWRLRRRLKRRNAGLCESCSYDVRAAESGLCPECGTVIPGMMP